MTIIKTFALVAHLFVGDGQIHDYVLDYNLTYEDCESSMYDVDLVATSSLLSGVDLTPAILACEEQTN